MLASSAGAGYRGVGVGDEGMFKVIAEPIEEPSKGAKKKGNRGKRNSRHMTRSIRARTCHMYARARVFVCVCIHAHLQK